MIREFEIDFEVKCTMENGTTHFVPITKTIECSCEFEYMDGYEVFCEPNDKEYDGIFEQTIEQFLDDENSINDCECYLEEYGHIDEFERVVSIGRAEEVVHDFIVFREDVSFDYGDSPCMTNEEWNLSGFKVTTFGTEVLVHKFEGYGTAFVGAKGEYRIWNLKDLNVFIEAVKQMGSVENFEYIADIVELNEFQNKFMGSVR